MFPPPVHAMNPHYQFSPLNIRLVTADEPRQVIPLITQSPSLIGRFAPGIAHSVVFDKLEVA